MANDISIEVLEPASNVSYGAELLCNPDFSNSSCWLLGVQSGTCAVNWNLSGGVITKSAGGCSYFEQPITLIEGHTYEITVAVKDYNRLGSLQLNQHGLSSASITVFNSSTICNGCDGSDSGTGAGQYAYITKQWTQGATNLNRIRFYSGSSTTMTISSISMRNTMADSSKVMGRLDASTTDDFPLAITFSVNDPANINARKGAYSKTFQIPATNNNNQVLKHLNLANSNNLDAILTEKLKCRILVGNLFSLVGLLQIKGVERLNNKPIYYSVSFLGDNLAWSTFLEAKYLSDLQLENSTNLKLGAKEIVKTWQADSCDSSTLIDGTNTVNTSPVVYPFVSYGRANETGNEYNSAVQMLRTKYERDWINNGTYGTPNSSQTGVYGAIDNGASFAPTPYTSKNPVNDWRPMVWIYNMMKKIFSDVGYSISSSFMETADFKKLVYATPNFLFNNPDQRYQANSYLGNFKDNSSCSATSANLMFHNVNTSDCIGMPDSSGGPYGGHSAFTETPLQFGGTCGSGIGSDRFQPKIGVIVNSGGLLQQDVTVFTGSGFTGWNINKAGYYKFTTSNLMWGIEFQGETGTGGASDWSGSGDFTGQPHTGVQFFAKIGVQCQTVGESGYCSRETIPDGDGQELTGFLDCNGSGSTGTYALYGTLDSTEYIGYFNAGDKVRFELLMNNFMQVYNPALNWTGTSCLDFKLMLWGTTLNNWSGSNGTVGIELYDEQVPVYGGEYNLQDIFPNNQKQLDFVKGVAHCFNLQFSTVESQKTVYIEPYTDFYLPPRDAIDWTWKLARNQSDAQHFIDNDFARKIVFKYKLDPNDWRVNNMSEVYFDSIGDNYPYQRDLGPTYPAGERVFENPFFAGTFDSQNRWGITHENNSSNFYSAALWKASYSWSSTKGYDFLPRILLYNKMTMPSVHDPQWQGFWVESLDAAPASRQFCAKAVQVSDVTDYPYGTFDTNGNFNSAFYNSATFMNRHNYSNQFGLCYGNYWAKDYDSSNNTYNAVGNQVGQGLYARYYQSMVDGLIDKPKVRICYIDLKIDDITQLDFRKMVYIDGVYYRLIKIFDYQPHLNAPTKVELHQWSPAQGSALPTAGVWINNNGTNTGGGPVGGGPIPIDPITEF